MNTKITRYWSMQFAIVIAVACVTWAGPASSEAQIAGAPRAVVQAVQGDANVVVDRDRGPTKLAVGSMVDAWNTVSTNENGKLFLKWETGVLNSIGGSTSIFLASREIERGPVDTIEMTEGLLRVTKPSGGGAGAPYMVVTPAASIEPANYDEPVDFIVEVYVPTTAVITVVSGNVRIKNLTSSRPTETVLSSCQTVYVEEGKAKLEPLASSPEDLLRLVDGTTIPGTIAANLDICPVTPPQQRAAEPRVSPGPRYAESSPYSDYEFEDWESRDMYPYDEIRVLQPRRGVGAVVELPGVGSWIIPFDVFAGWRFDPDIILIYSRHIILDNIIYRDQYYLADLRLQQRQFRDLAYLSQLSGNRGMLWDAQRQMANLNIQEDWAARRLNHLQNTVAGLEQEQHKFAQKLPRGKNLFQAVSNSFNSPKNLKVVQNFRDRIKTDLNVQDQLAGLAGKELTDLRSRVAHERDPQKRFALRDGLTKINQDVAQGKLPIRAKQPQVKQVVDKLAREQDPKKLQHLQKQLGRLTKTEAPRTAELLSPDRLASLRRDLAKFPNAQKRNDLEAGVGQLEQSVEQRKHAELTREKIDTITAQAAKQRNVRKRNELLGQLKELAKPALTGAGPVGGLNFLGQRQNLESQLSIEQDKQKRAALEKALEDQRKKQAELLRQAPARGRQTEVVPKQREDLRKQTERQRLEQDRQKQTEQTRQQQLGRQKQLEGKELQKQQSGQKRQEILQQRQQKTEQKHLQQQDQQKQLEKRRLEQAEQRRQQKEKTEQTHRTQQQTEQLHKRQQQQQQQQQQVDQQRHQKEQAEQTHRKQQQTEQLHKQQQQQQRQQVDQQRHQKEQAEQTHRRQQQTEQAHKQQQQQQRQAPRVQQQQQQRQAPRVQQQQQQRQAPQQQRQQAPQVQRHQPQQQQKHEEGPQLKQH